MAKILPDGWREMAQAPAAAREIETLERLALALPDAYSVVHAVHWTRMGEGFAVFDAISFVVVNRAGECLLIEQIGGLLEEGAEGLVKCHPGRRIELSSRMLRSLTGLRQRLAVRPHCAALRLDYLLYCPDYRVRELPTAGLDPTRIVDHAQRENLPAAIQALLPEGEAGPATREVHRFLRDIVALEADVSALLGRAEALVTRVAGGLAQWARQLEFTPYRLRVVGTAGCGKTQLALAEYRTALEAGKRPLYVCFNRPLAEHFRAIAPAGGVAASFHQFCDDRLRAAGRKPDFSAADAFKQLIAAAEALPPQAHEGFDTLIIDEGQDFSPQWRDLVLRHAREEARLLWLEDPNQNLYARDPVPLPGWVSLHARTNYRSPRPVVALLHTLGPEFAGIEAACPLAGEEVDFLPYEDAATLQQSVKEGIRRCLAAGFRREDIVILSYRGRENSQLFALDRLGPHRLRRFTGEYDLLGQPCYSAGDVLLDSVYRFKGQAAPAILLAEVDFETLDERAARKIFVGASRAALKLVVVATPQATSLLGGGRS